MACTSRVRFSNASKLKNFEAMMTKGGSRMTYRATPIITTIYNTQLTEYDLREYIENGLRIIRFKLTLVSKEDKRRILKVLEKAITLCCQKYHIRSWPIAVCIDVPNACIKTGFLAKDIPKTGIVLQEGNIVELTKDVTYKSKCDHNKIYINDPYTFPSIKPGTEITVRFGQIVMTCMEVVDDQTIKCKVIKEGILHNRDLVCLRGVKLLRPPLGQKEKQIIEFAKQIKCDMITINVIRDPATIKAMKALFRDQDKMPLFISSICEQEGLDNLDEIIKESDAIILAREFLAFSIENTNDLLKIQLHVSAKCKLYGKPFYISGNILEGSLSSGIITGSDLSDITSALHQGAGFLLREYEKPAKMVTALRLINYTCANLSPHYKYVEEFWSIPYQHNKFPVTAADACIESCFLAAKVLDTKIVVILTVTGKTAMQLSLLSNNIFIFAVATDPTVVRQLLLYSGVIPVMYSGETEGDWNDKVKNRIHFAIEYGYKFNLVQPNTSFVVLRRHEPTSAYSDQVSLWKVWKQGEHDNDKKRYGILLWGNATDIQTTFVLQKRAVHAICKLKVRDSLRAKFKAISILAAPAVSPALSSFIDIPVG